MIRRISCGLLLALALAVPAGAERAWIDDELVVPLRAGAGTNYKIRSYLRTGQSVDIVARTDDWVHVRVGEDKSGWLQSRYIQREPPAEVRLERQQADTVELRQNFESISREVEDLRGTKDALASREAELREELERLTRENAELRAGARWPEWIAGASILGVGGILGIFVQWSSSRRTTRRIRL